MDKHAPEVTRVSVLRPNAPWFNSHLQELKRTKRQCERRYISTRLEVHHQIYREQCAIYLTEINATKSDYYRNKIMEKDPNQLFHLIAGLFHVKKEKPLPTCDSTTKIAQQFSLFFASKIEKLRADIPTQVQYCAKVMQVKCANFVLCLCEFSSKNRPKIRGKIRCVSSDNSL